jgi:hypothetical protein
MYQLGLMQTRLVGLGDVECLCRGDPLSESIERRGDQAVLAPAPVTVNIAAFNEVGALFNDLLDYN